MKCIKHFFLFLLVLFSVLPAAGCWNYREIDKLGIVAGVAVDKGTSHKYRITVEIVEISQGRDAKPRSKIIAIEGDSMFDAVRNEISVTGKRLYWSHAKVLILSREIAENGVVKIIDWYNRDSETRSDVNIMVSGEATAGQIFEGQSVSESIKSFELSDMLDNEASLSKAPHTETLEFTNNLEADGITPIIPRVILKTENGNTTPRIDGTAVFRKDELVGFLNGDETKYLLFVKNEVKGGVLVPYEKGVEGEVPVSLEVFKNRTSVRPDVKGGNAEVNISTDTEVSIDEIEGSENYIDDGARKKLESDTGMMLKNRIEQLIKKMQTEFGVDIFGFGARLHEDNPKAWRKVSGTWEESFRNLKVNVKSKIHIRNSAMLSRTIRIGD